LEHCGGRASLPSDPARRSAAWGFEHHGGTSHAPGRASRVSQAGVVAGFAYRRSWDANPRYSVSGWADRGAGTYEGRVLTSTEFGDFTA